MRTNKRKKLINFGVLLQGAEFIVVPVIEGVNKHLDRSMFMGRW